MKNFATKHLIKTGFLYVLVALLFVSCTKTLPLLEEPTPVDENSVFGELIVNENFDWETSSYVKSSIYTLSNTGTAISDIKVSLRTDYLANNGKDIAGGFTNSDGHFQMDYRLATITDSLVVATNYLGFVSGVKVPVIDGNLNWTFGGVPDRTDEESAAAAFKRTSDTEIDLKDLGSWKSDGTPRYLEKDEDDISSDFLADLNDALPENQPVPDYHPEYLSDQFQQYITITEESDVYVTFVTEGAGYLNTLCFYTFNENNPPESIDDIDEATIIFPNASFKHSGGGLYSGDKVKIGEFDAGTSIGWLLIADGFDTKEKDVKDGRNYFFSQKNLNPENNPDNQQHIVLLKDEERDLFLIAFEDLERPDGDNDFNDVVFYVTSDPADGISNTGIPKMGEVYVDNDTDKDGVDNTSDAYPEDVTKAFNNYYPSQGNYATLAFEDLWPSKGDYDFNDLVLDYNFNTITNADNKVVQLEGDFIVRANGAGFKNGFGFELSNILSSQVNSVSGNDLQEGYINLNNNGTEAGQTNATIIVLDNAKNHNQGFWNTDPSKAFVEPTKTVRIVITFTSPISQDQFGLAPFNPFIIINEERGRELHLPNYQPTNLADLSYFGEYNDDSNLSSGKLYKTVGNLPWAINFPSQFDYPIEKASISTPYLKFISWVESSGTLFPDWYLDLSGYRDTDYIY
ncbi:MAG: LruC domain-containing protein [Bacteroidales bacterium]|nr:LruC domain-containing protein [Bacteroidales bacterium]